MSELIEKIIEILGDAGAEDVRDIIVQIQKLEEENKKLKEQVQIDALTGIYNRRTIFGLLEKELQKALREKSGITIAMIDVDFFKRINDTYGHPIGDKVLKEIATRMRKRLRPYEHIGRYGGEEFLIISTGQKTVELATKILERIAEEVRNSVIEAGDISIPVTISIGFTCLMNDKEITAEELVSTADKALYTAKENGRDRVEFQPI